MQDAPALYLHGQGVKVELVASNALILRKRHAGRIDLWAAGDYRGKVIAAKENMPDAKPVYVFREVDHYLACKLTMPAAHIAARNEAVASMWRDGWMKIILDRYQTMPVK